MILEKPLLFFIPDYHEYNTEIGVFVDICQLKYPVCYKEEEIISHIQNNQFDQENMRNMKNCFFDYQDGQSTKRVIEFLETQN